MTLAVVGRRSWKAFVVPVLVLIVLALDAPALAQESGWSADLEYLAVQLEARHPDLYHTLPRDRFHQELEDLATRAPASSDLGRKEEATDLVCRAFAIDPQFDRALERSLDCPAAGRRRVPPVR